MTESCNYFLSLGNLAANGALGTSGKAGLGAGSVYCGKLFIGMTESCNFFLAVNFAAYSTLVASGKTGFGAGRSNCCYFFTSGVYVVFFVYSGKGKSFAYVNLEKIGLSCRKLSILIKSAERNYYIAFVISVNGEFESNYYAGVVNNRTSEKVSHTTDTNVKHTIGIRVLGNSNKRSAKAICYGEFRRISQSFFIIKNIYFRISKAIILGYNQFNFNNISGVHLGVRRLQSVSEYFTVISRGHNRESEY